MTTRQKYSKFQDIPPLAEGNYRADIPLDHIEKQLEQYAKYPGLDLDPDYQRVHVWSQAQQEAFVEHLLKGGKNNVIRLNSVNWRSPTAKWGPVQLVDGKQRLTATLLFMENRLRAFGSLLREFRDQVPMTDHLTLVINHLPDRASVLRWYLEINEGNVAHTRAELQKVRDMLLETRPESQRSR